MVTTYGAIGAGVIVVGVLLVRWVSDHSFGPRSSAAIALVLFAGMLGVVVLWRRIGRHDVDGRLEDGHDSEGCSTFEGGDGGERYEG